jgi:hypothetical protein
MDGNTELTVSVKKEGKMTIFRGKRQYTENDVDWTEFAERFRAGLCEVFNEKEESKMDEATVHAIKDSVAHWERMYKKVLEYDIVYCTESFMKNPDKSFIKAVSDRLSKDIGETWWAKHCSLCKTFGEWSNANFGVFTPLSFVPPHIVSCGNCPLCEKFGACNSYNRENKYGRVIESKNFSELLYCMCDFIDQLKSLLPKKQAGKLVIEVLDTKWGKVWRVKEQTYRGKGFFNGENTFCAKNGLMIISESNPACNIDDNSVYVRGRRTAYDDIINSIWDEVWLEELRVAVREYNQRQKELAGECVAEWVKVKEDEVEIIQ